MKNKGDPYKKVVKSCARSSLAWSQFNWHNTNLFIPTTSRDLHKYGHPATPTFSDHSNPIEKIFTKMSHPSVGPVVVAGYPSCGQSLSGNAVTSGVAMQLQQPGHDLHSAAASQRANPQYFHTYTVSPQPVYSLPTPTTSDSRVSTPTVFPTPNYSNLLFFRLLAAWPMSGPSYPDAVAAYLQGRGPMPDLNVMQAQLAKVNADFAAGAYNLENPSIANPATIISFWTDGVDVTKTPWIRADGRYGVPLPVPEALGAVSAGFVGQQELSNYNGIMM